MTWLKGKAKNKIEQPERNGVTVHSQLISFGITGRHLRAGQPHTQAGGRVRNRDRHQEGAGVTPEVEMRKPLPSAVHVIPVAADWQRNGPTPVTVP